MTALEIPITGDTTSEWPDDARHECEQLRSQLLARDLECVRLRDVLCIALTRLTAEGDEADRAWTAEMHARWFK